MAIVSQLRPAFSRLRTFQWFVIILAAMTVRIDSMGGVSSHFGEAQYIYRFKIEYTFKELIRRCRKIENGLNPPF